MRFYKRFQDSRTQQWKRSFNGGIKSPNGGIVHPVLFVVTNQRCFPMKVGLMEYSATLFLRVRELAGSRRVLILLYYITTSVFYNKAGQEHVNLTTTNLILSESVL